MILIKIFCILLILNLKLFAQNQIQISLSSERTRIYEDFRIKWHLVTNYNPKQVEYRYKLDVPGEGLVNYANNEWSSWIDGLDGNLIYSDFIIEGRYKFSVEYRLKLNHTKIASDSRYFDVFWEYPEIREEAFNINWEKVNAAKNKKEFYSILSEEYYHSYLMWYQKAEYQYNLLKHTIPLSELLDETGKNLVLEGYQKLLEKSAYASAKIVSKIILPVTIYEIIKLGITDLILIYRNIEANKAFSMTLISKLAYEFFGELAKKENYSDNEIITLAFILDSSGSMVQNDPQDMRKSAVEMIINELNGNEYVFIIDFDDKALWLNKNNYHNYNKEMLKNDVKRINSDGGTNIETGLIELKQAIESAGISYSKGGALLLTDGKNNNPFDFTALDWFLKNKFSISTVSFVGDVDNKLLSDIAAMTNGKYFRANNAYDIVIYFREFINSISGNSSLKFLRNKIQQGELQQYSFYVDRGMAFIYLGLNWNGSRIRLKLISPSKKVYKENDINGEWNLGNNYSSVKILNPESGKWNVELYGESIPISGEEYVFQVIGDSPNKISIEEKLLVNGQIQFDLKNNSGNNFYDIKSKIEVITPKNRKEDISNSFSGIGFNYRPRDGQGNYNFEIHLTGKDNNGSIIERYFSRTVLVGEGSPSNIAPIKMVEGNYLYADLGKNIGNFEGLRCKILSSQNNKIIGEGVVIYVSETECIIEIQQYSDIITKGDIIELDITQWQQDF